MFKRCIFLVAVALATTAVSFAQFEAGTVTGSIKDPSGAVVPGATVEIRNQMTNGVRTATTSAGGQFDFVAVQPGKYTLTAQQQGFRSPARSFDLSVGQRLEVD